MAFGLKNLIVVVVATLVFVANGASVERRRNVDYCSELDTNIQIQWCRMLR